MRDANIHKVLQIMHITSVKRDIKVRGWGGHGLSVTMTLRDGPLLINASIQWLIMHVVKLQ